MRGRQDIAGGVAQHAVEPPHQSDVRWRNRDATTLDGGVKLSVVDGWLGSTGVRSHHPVGRGDRDVRIMFLIVLELRTVTDLPSIRSTQCPVVNEEAAIGKVVSDFRAALPNATVYVYDNNSTDKTIEVRDRRGCRRSPR